MQGGREFETIGQVASLDDVEHVSRDTAVTVTVANRLGQAREEFVRHTPAGVRLALKVLLVGIICHLAIQVGHQSKLPPHDISALWPASAILVSVLVASPIRHWWAYLLGGYATYAIDVARAGFLVSDALYQLADIIKVLIAAVGVRWFADGLRAFDSLRSLARYIGFAVLVAPAISGLVAAAAGGTESYWFYWRAWYFSEALAFLTLAPAILTWIKVVQTPPDNVTRDRVLEGTLLACGLFAISVGVFTLAGEGESVPTLVYLPLPFLLWAAVRFGPTGINTALLAVAFLAISGVVRGRGPFSTGAPSDNVLPLQLFLITLSLPLMCLAALVTERRAKTEALRESESRFRTMADTAPVLMWMSDTRKLCTFFNKSWLDFTGRTLAQELGDGWVEGVHPDDRERCLAIYVDAFDARREFAMEYRLRRHDGEYRWVYDKGVPRGTAEGTFLGYIGCADDITPLREAELTSERHRAELAHVARLSTMGELAVSLAHELNQPLGAILSNADAVELLLDAEPPKLEDARRVLLDLKRANQRASDVVVRIREMLRKRELAFELYDLNAAAAEIVRLLEMDAMARGVQVLTEFESLPVVRGDRLQFQQVLLNLFMNGMDAMAGTPAGRRYLIVRTLNREDRHVEIAVADSGGGIDAAHSLRLFEWFFTTKKNGMGLGLALCRSIVQAHGGRIWAENSTGGGATIRFVLPVDAEQRNPHANPSTPGTPA